MSDKHLFVNNLRLNSLYVNKNLLLKKTMKADDNNMLEVQMDLMIFLDEDLFRYFFYEDHLLRHVPFEQLDC